MNDLKKLRRDFNGTLTRVAMRDMTIPQARVFAINVNLHADLYVEKLVNYAVTTELEAIRNLKYETVDAWADAAHQLILDRIDALTSERKNWTDS